MKNIFNAIVLVGIIAFSTACFGQSSLISTFAGSATRGWSGDGSPATAAELDTPVVVLVDPVGNVFFCDAGNNRVRKVNTSMIISEVAGNGTPGFSGDGSPASNAELDNPSGLAMDAVGNLYISDQYNHVVRKVSVANNCIYTIAGTPDISGYSGNGGAATAAKLYRPYGLDFDSYGNLYIADQYNHAVRKITATSDSIKGTNIISSICGYDVGAYNGDNQPASSAELYYPTFVHLDPYNNIYISDNGNQRVRKIVASRNDTIITVAGNGLGGWTGDGTLATNSEIDYPGGMKTDELGNLYFAVYDNRIRKVNAAGIISTIADNSGTSGFGGDGGAATAADLWEPNDVAIDKYGNILIADLANSRIRIIESGAGRPGFVNGENQNLTVCENSVGDSINSLLAVNDTDHGLPENWTLRSGPYNGYVAATYSVTTTGSVLTPVGLYYTPNTNYSGPDSFKVWVNNGYAVDSTTIVVNVQSFFAGMVTPNPVNICPGVTVNLSSDTAGGTWHSNNSSIATVSGSGLVTGISPGNAIVSYSISNSCGTSASRALVIVGNETITTFAGTGIEGHGTDGGAATATALNWPTNTAMDAAGNVYYTDYTSGYIRKVTTAGVVYTVGGNGILGWSGDGGAATAAEIYNPSGIALDNSGNLYFTDYTAYVIRKINLATDIITTIGGTGVTGGGVDGVAATTSAISRTWGCITDANGNLYFSDRYNHKIRVITPSGYVHTVAGNGTAGFSGDGGQATAAELNQPLGIALDLSGNLYISDASNARIRKVSTTGIITTICGNGISGSSGDGFAATSASVEVNTPAGIYVDSAYNIYIDEWSGNRARIINTSGIINTISGNGIAAYNGDGIPATSAEINTVQGIQVYGSGSIYICDEMNERIREIIPEAPIVPTSITGGNSVCQSFSIGLTDAVAGGAWTSSNTTVATTSTGYGLVTGIAAGTTVISYSIANSCGPEVTTEAFTVNQYAPVTIEPAIVCPGNTITLNDAISGGGWSSSSTSIATVSGGIVIGETIGNDVISYAIPGGCDALAEVRVGNPIITTFAGIGTEGYTGDGGAATAAQMYYPHGLSIDPTTGLIYIADDLNSVIRRVDPTTGIIITVAGTGITGYSGEGIATAVEMNDPFEILADGFGNLYITDAENNRVRKVVLSTGMISTIAGTGVAGSIGDGGVAATCELNTPGGLALDAAGNLYIGDIHNNKVRVISPAGIINTFAGTGSGTFGGDNGPATLASFYNCNYIRMDPNGNLIVVDNGNQRIRRINIPSTIVTTIAGTGTAGNTGDNGPATSAELDFPGNVAFDGAGNMYIATDVSEGVRMVNTSGIITTVVGTGVLGYTGDGGPPTAATLHTSVDVTFDAAGNLFVADQQNNVVRKIITVTPTAPAAISGASSVCQTQNLVLTDAAAGGTWSSSNTSVATISSAYGLVTGIAAGSTVITYQIINSCGPEIATKIIGVNQYAPITPEPGIVCPGNNETLSDVISGGAWSSSNTGIATVAGGIVNGVSAGNVIISYAMSGGCVAYAVVEVGNPIINTIAGGGTGGLGDGGAATSATLSGPTSTITDAAGNIYIADFSNNRIRKINTSGVISTIAGNGTAGSIGDGTAAVSAELNTPTGICLDASGNLYIADYGNNKIRIVNTSGIIGTFAGTGTAGYTGDGSAATGAELYKPTSLVMDAAGNLYFTDGQNCVVRKISSTQIIKTIAGIGTPGFSGDNGPATTAQLWFPWGIALDGSDNVYIADGWSNRIREINQTGVINTIAGTGPAGSGTGSYGGDGGAATNAHINYPVGVYVDKVGNVILSEMNSDIVREVNTSGIINTIAGTATVAGFSGDNGPATAAKLDLPHGIWEDPSGNIYISDYQNNRVREITTVGNTMAAITGLSSVCQTQNLALTDATTGGTWSSSNPSVAIVASAYGVVTGVSTGATMITYLINNSCGLEYATHSVTVNQYAPITPEAGIVCPGNNETLSDAISGGAWSSSNNTIATIAGGTVNGVSGGNVIITYAMSGGCEAFALVNVGNPIINTIAGGGTGTGENIPATTAQLNPNALAIDGSGNIYVTDFSNNRIRKITTTGNIYTVAGTGTAGYTFDGIAATNSELNSPVGIAIDRSGNLYIADVNNNRIRMVNTSGIISTVAGNGTGAYYGDGGLAVDAELSSPKSLAFDASGNLYIGDQGNDRVREINTSGIISTVAGNGSTGFSGDGGAATLATFRLIDGIAIDIYGNLIISDVSNYRVREVNTSGIVSTIAGSATSGFSGDGGPATNATLWSQDGVATDRAGNIYIADLENYRVRRVNTSGIIETIAGYADFGFAGDGGPATAAELDLPNSVLVDPNNNIYIADNGNGRIREITTVGNTMAAITGTVNVCVGTTTNLADATGGGTWISNSPGIATIGSNTGIVTGVASGSSIITYETVLSCGASYVTTTVNVNNNPSALSPRDPSICQFNMVTLTDATSGGTWSSSASTVASVTGGTVSGLTVGTAIITYAVGTCTVADTVTVKSGPEAISGTPSVCTGNSTDLADATLGGTWSSSSSAVGSVGTSGIVTGVTSGTVTISYTSGTCSATVTVTVSMGPAVVTGNAALCVDASEMLHDAITGGTWASSNSGVASIVIGTGNMTGAGSGTATITYFTSANCYVTTQATVNANPAAITGSDNICVGSGTILNNSTSGGTWVSSNLAVGTIGSLSGSVQGVSQGTLTISYMLLTNGCYSTTGFTVNPLPGAITGTTSACVGGSSMLSDGTSGGSWISGNTTVGTISSSGNVTGLLAGSTIITYQMGTSCQVTTIFTVNPNPAAILGTDYVCIGSTTALTDGTSGGAWSSSNSSVAAVTGGTVSGATVGAAMISYTLSTGCYATTGFTVNPVPVPILGTKSLCTGLTTLLTDGTGGGVWTSSNLAIGSVLGGDVTGIGVGTVTISYSLGTGCLATTVVTVNQTPDAITGAGTLCSGNTETLGDGISGGTWVSVSSGVATINATTGYLTAIASGTSIISYIMATGCYQTTTVAVTTGPTAINGIKTVCAGSTTDLSDFVLGGSWASNTTSVATIGTMSGIVTGVSSGSSIITYYIGTSCYITTTVAVNAVPAAIMPPGGINMCPGYVTSLTDGTGGGTWSSENVGVATVGSTTGSVTGVSAGTVIISYTAAGCSALTTATIDVAPGPISPSNPIVCVGGVTDLTDALSGGVWTSASLGIATVGSSSGIVSGVVAGTTSITYTLGTCYVAETVTVSGVLTAGTISGLTQMCITTPITLSETVGAGAWTSGNTAVATVGASSGTVSGVGSGTVIITYTESNTCGTAYTTTTITVDPVGGGTITGPASICAGTYATYSDPVPGGTWSLSNVAASVTGGGLVTGITSGSDILTYNVSNACGTSQATKTISIGAYLTAGTITGASTVCAGANTMLGDLAPGGVWGAGNAYATVSAGLVTGVAAGVDTISYTVTSSCGSAFALHAMTVLPIPTAGVLTGPSMLCVGTPGDYTDGTTGGTWSLSSGTASISVTGVVTPLTAGSNIVSYTVTNACGSAYATATVSIGAIASAGTISGPTTVCAGSTIMLTDGATGGVWTAGNTDATVSAGLVTGVLSGTDIISYTVSGSCGSVSATSVITINPLPNAGTISGPTNICTSGTATYTDAVGGGTWSVYNATATIAGGVVTPVSTGTNIISYIVSNTCGTAYTTQQVIIGAGPTAGSISGASLVCSAMPVTLTDAVSGGVWSSSSTDATVSGGVVTGVANGTTTISYTVTNSCGTVTATQVETIVVSPNAGIISGPSALCLGTPANYTDAATGGVWSVVNADASISGTGLVTPLVGGTETISYTVSNTCGTVAATANVAISTSSSAGTIAGPSSVCIGTTIDLTDGVAGGVWTSASPAVVTIGSGTGVVTGVGSGTATLSYTITNGCGTGVATAVVTSAVTPYAGTIIGPATVCAGAFNTYADGAPGGTWRLTNANATITTGGVVTGVTPLTTDTVEYMATTACGTATATMTIAIGPVLSAGTITGPAQVCAGASVTLTDGAGSGVWYSNTGSVASIGAGTGVVDGLSPGTTTISYTVSAACGTVVTTSVITVAAFPSAGTIGGATEVCDGATASVTDAVAGGTWSFSNTNASVSGGLISGLIPGLDTLTYSVTNVCGTATTTATIGIVTYPVSGIITGPTSVCPGASISLGDASLGGSWSSANSNAMVGSLTGIVTGIASGADNISYTVTNACGSNVSLVNITITSAPNAGTITGPDSVCIGSAVTLTDVAGGGVWSVANSNATIDGTGDVTGLVAGYDPVTYTVTNACGVARTTALMTINTSPVAGAISGPATVCVGSGITLSETESGGAWLASNTNASVVGPGVIYGMTVGIDTIYYVVSNSCGVASAMQIVTVNPVPVVPAITGSSEECTGTMVTLGDVATGGVWSSSNPTVASVGISSGIVNGLSAGSTVITYTVTNSYGCPTTVTAPDSVINAPVVPAIDGAAAVCMGSSVALSDSVSGGLWNSSMTTVATVNPTTGEVTGIAPGTVIISYQVLDVCGVTTVTRTESVGIAPTLAAIMGGAASECAGTSATFTDATSGGYWVSGNTAIATVGTYTGIVTGTGGGLDTIYYAISGACGVTSVSTTININPLPDAGVITGAGAVCIGSAITLTASVSGGAWSTGNADATVLGGVVTGVSAGADPISYSVTNSCGTTSAVTTVAINSFPTVDSVLGVSSVCTGSTITLTDATTGGVWSVSNTDAIVTGGMVMGISAGIDTVIYTVANACASVAAMHIVTVGVSATAGTISGPSTVCAGSSITLTETATGGTWSASNGDATVTGGDVVGILAGADTIYYNVAGTCGTARAMQVVTIGASPVAGTLAGASAVCVGSSITLTATGSGGAWSAANTNASVSGGIVTGVAAGADVISYTVTNACGSAFATWAIVVSATSGAGTITGTATVCTGSSITLSDAVSGGVWSSSGAAATVSGGVVTGRSAGIDTIKYTAWNGCGSGVADKVITVMAGPYAGNITGAETDVCPGSSITLTDVVPGGAWSSSSTSVAVVSGGVVTGVTAGTTNIVYTVTNTCGSAAATMAVTVLTDAACNTGVGVVNGSQGEMKVYPNPNQGTFTINITEVANEAATVIVTNVVGQQVQEYVLPTNKENQVILNEPAGVYVIKASTAHGEYVAKVTVE